MAGKTTMKRASFLSSSIWWGGGTAGDGVYTSIEQYYNWAKKMKMMILILKHSVKAYYAKRNGKQTAESRDWWSNLNKLKPAISLPMCIQLKYVRLSVANGVVSK